MRVKPTSHLYELDGSPPRPAIIAKKLTSVKTNDQTTRPDQSIQVQHKYVELTTLINYTDMFFLYALVSCWAYYYNYSLFRLVLPLVQPPLLNRVAEGGVTLPALKIRHDQLPPGVDQDTVSIFVEIYKQHLNQLLDAVINLNFTSIQHIWVKLAIPLPSICIH